MNTGSGGMTRTSPQLADGFADTAAQDAFCSGTICTISHPLRPVREREQSQGRARGPLRRRNVRGLARLRVERDQGHADGRRPQGLRALHERARGLPDPLNVKAKDVPTGNTAQGIYELADGTHSGTACCWDFGNVSPDPTQYVTMNTLFFGTGFWGKGAGSGPWFMGDFEGGVWAGGSAIRSTVNNQQQQPVDEGSLRPRHPPHAGREVRAQDGRHADGHRSDDRLRRQHPSGKTWGNAGGIVLGVGGDNSNNSWGTFYEGAVTNGSPTNATDLAVMQNIQAAGYGSRMHGSRGR